MADVDTIDFDDTHPKPADRDGKMPLPEMRDPLNKLPAELRLHIYGYVLAAPCCLGQESQAHHPM